MSVIRRASRTPSERNVPRSFAMEINIIGTMFYGNDAMQKNHFRSKFFMVRENMPASYRMQYV